MSIEIKRRLTKEVKIGQIKIGGNNPIAIQSMTNTKTKDVEKTIKQILELEKAGCDIVRVAILDNDDALAIKKIKEAIHIPLVADIHFNGNFAITAIESGVDKIRLNPGNIKDENMIERIVNLCMEKDIPIRIGINTGSLDKKYQRSPESMILSAKDHIRILEKLNFKNIVLSFKSSDPFECIEAYRLASKEFNYPIHLGLTEAGGLLDSSIKSTLALGNLLLEGIGDTIRISISDDPKEEINVAKKLLKACKLKNNVPNLISCPTCGRIQYDMLPISKQIEEYLKGIEKNITVAIMGCPVNGPGEAKEADIGIAGAKDSAILFKKGQIVKTIKQEDIVKVLKEEIDKF